MILYKYCPWDDYTKENLKKNQLYPQIASNENDPFDHLPAFNKQDWCFKLSKEKKISFLDVTKDINVFLNLWIDEIKKHAFIICLSEKYNDILMWSHYANFHKGVCIGYDVSECCYSNGVNKFIPVTYSDKRVLIPPKIFRKTADEILADPELLKVINDLVSTKSTEWEYEKEYRIVETNEKTREENVEKNVSVVSIYIGCSVDENTAKEIKNFVRQNCGPRVKIFKMKTDQYNFALNEKPF